MKRFMSGLECGLKCKRHEIFVAIRLSFTLKKALSFEDLGRLAINTFVICWRIDSK